MAEAPNGSKWRARDFIDVRLRELRASLEARGVVHASLFGSVARGDDLPESDVDIILEDHPERRIDLFDLMDIAEFLESELGRRVDLGTRASLRPGKHDEILADLREVF